MYSDELLTQVQNPAQYVGSEHNMVVKDPHAVDARMVLCYPDVYEVGMAHVGLHILYHTVNQRPDAYCERAFHPQLDAAALLRSHDAPLCSLETGTPLAAFDVIGITLQHELTYASVLGLLSLGGVPVRRAERGDCDPLVLGGGPCALNPEPMSEFFDAFVIGDGEDAIHEVLDTVIAHKGHPRERLLEALGNLPGVYVPAVHDPQRASITRRIVADLDRADYPTAPIVPYVEAVHDRAQIEVARGCTRGCRFCQAGIVYRPVRERRLETLRGQAREIIARTGYDEISLVSLNCPDYSDIEPLIDGLHHDLSEQRVSVGLPSLRIDTFSVDLAHRVRRVRKSGLTLAPEAGSQRLRDAINKGVTEDDILRTTRAAFEAGWHTIKLYFMIGLPTETDADVLAIADLVRAVAKLGRETLAHRASRMKLNVSVATLVPKAHTPLQWDGQIPQEEIIRRRRILQDTIRDRQVRVSCHDPRQSVLEAALARGGRDTGKAILAAFEDGASLDAWTEHIDFPRWQNAFTQAGLSLEAEAARSFSLDDRLPWQHIRTGVTREFLLAERARVSSAELTPDCRIEGCVGCGLAGVAGCPATVGGERP